MIVCAVACGCEDEHPPIVSEPVEAFQINSETGERIMTVAFDPRGVGLVLPSGELANQWVDTDDPTGAWHYREWQWWKGHPWGDSCRPRYYADVKFRPSDNASRGAAISYRIDGFDCRQIFFMPDKVDRDAPHWDLVTTVRNMSGHEVVEYGQFFACYTPVNRGRSFWYWDESGELVRFADRGVGHLDGYIAHPRAYFLQHGAIPHCPRGGGKVVGRWRRPVIVSQASSAGWRSVILLEERFTASLAQGIEGRAMDYILFPGPDKRSFADDAEFSTHIRHVMLRSPELPTTQHIEELWSDFERSHAATHERAARL